MSLFENKRISFWWISLEYVIPCRHCSDYSNLKHNQHGIVHRRKLDHSKKLTFFLPCHLKMCSALPHQKGWPFRCGWHVAYKSCKTLPFLPENRSCSNFTVLLAPKIGNFFDYLLPIYLGPRLPNQSLKCVIPDCISVIVLHSFLNANFELWR